MRIKRMLFARYMLTTKEQLIISVKDYLAHCKKCNGSVERWSTEKTAAIIKAVESFLQLLQKTSLPDLRELWYYDYKLTGKAVQLELCHCSDMNVDPDGLNYTADDAWFTLLNIPYAMLTVQEYAIRHRTTAATVLRWARCGKLRYIEKREGKWLISEFVDPPGRKYVPVTYHWQQPIPQLQNRFPFLGNSTEVYISKKPGNRKAYRINLWNHDSGSREVMIDLKECQAFERAILAIPGVEVQELNANLFFEEPIPQNREVMQSQVAALKEKLIEDSELDYGPVIVTRGKMKGRIGYYDCEDDKGCIVCFGNIRYYDGVHFIKPSFLSNTIPTNRILERLVELDKELFDSPGFEDDYERLLEMNYCDNLIFERYFRSMNNKPTRDFKIFLSHATEDLTFARALATDLMDAGYEVFLDDWSISLGENIINKINENLDDSDAFIPLFSQSFLQSVYCRDEWTSYYMRFSKTHPESIYPILLDACEVPALLAAIKYIRYHEHKGRQTFLQPLLTALRKAEERKSMLSTK